MVRQSRSTQPKELVGKLEKCDYNDLGRVLLERLQQYCQGLSIGRRLELPSFQERGEAGMGRCTECEGRKMGAANSKK